MNALYLAKLILTHFPVYIPFHQRELYKKLFLPLKVTKKVITIKFDDQIRNSRITTIFFQNFHLLMKDSYMDTLRAGKSLAVENETDLSESLRVLLSGKLAVKCDETFLHFVQPFEFVDSIEWRAREGPNPGDKSQVGTEGTIK